MLMLRSSIGKKVVMAVTGLLLFGFVIAHLAGNLLIYRGPDVLNAYADKLRHMGLLLWTARAGLLATVAVHFWLGIMLTRENRLARPIRYAVSRSAETTPAARMMMISGLLLTAFIIYHLLHFTVRITHPDLSHRVDALGRHDVYAMVVLSFQDPRLVVCYVVAMGLLCAHLHHGVASWLQSLGLTSERLLPVIERAGRLTAWLVFLGYSSIPVAIVLGFLGPSGR
jgi:succinate dehydrogenase / fumarate reductase cytochrome b subunit